MNRPRSLTRITGARNLGLRPANVNVMTISPENITSFTGNEVQYAKPTAGTVSVAPSHVASRATRSTSPTASKATPYSALGGKRKTRRRRARKTPRRK
jgi:hypothetical protein